MSSAFVFGSSADGRYAGVAFVPDNTVLYRYGSEQYQSWLRAAAAPGGSHDATVERCDRGTLVHNRVLRAVASDSLSTRRLRLPENVLVVGDRLDTGIRLCNGTLLTCGAGKHVCDGLFGVLADRAELHLMISGAGDPTLRWTRGRPQNPSMVELYRVVVESSRTRRDILLRDPYVREAVTTVRSQYARWFESASDEDRARFWDSQSDGSGPR